MRPALTLLMLLAAAPALAQDSASSATSASATGTAQGKKAPRKVIRLDAITVEGRIQKPQAFYILPRSNLSFDDLGRTESFVPKVVKSVEQDPF
ncbi:hypothetical protein [Pyxidicoccus xibeiensis]|uniref:hypothetical protein n=1 Tax=Pyxidicoccus xibeiensis TaxID=2906759 RepID=UPI0020A772A3|nr:hypothetical protein [Pyxidicoccus xibeiensis]MCP3138534.1 hypothetical protein [Pyxidicoccus xibeiensis]